LKFKQEAMLRADRLDYRN